MRKFYTELNIEQCKSLIIDEIYNKDLSESEQSLIGNVNTDNNKFLLINNGKTLKKVISRGFYGRLIEDEQDEHGTVIKGRFQFRLKIFALLFIWYWCFGLILSSVMSVVSIFRGYSFNLNNPVESVIVILSLVLFMLFIVVLSIHLSKPSEKCVIDFIENKLKAKEM